MSNKKRTAVLEKAKAARLTNATVEVGEAEILKMVSFFGLLGMKKDFLDEHPDKGYTRKKLDYALSSKSFKIAMLKDVRKFIADHSAEVSEFLNAPAA